MAINIPSTAIKQVRHNDFLDDSGDRGLSLLYKGTSYSDLKTAAEGYKQGDEVETGWVLKNWNLEGVPGGGGLLTLNCVPADTWTEQGATTQYPKDETWTCKSVRNDISILAYCGTSPGGNPNRVDIEMWMKEPDSELAKAYKYKRDENSEEVELSAPSKAVAEKISKGTDSVIRFYPILTRTRKYDTCPDNMLENLGLVDTPPTPGTYIDNPNIPQSSRKKVKKPSNITTIIQDHEWLKCQDDTTEQGDGSFIRAESWMGVKKTDVPQGTTAFDPDLYGPNRWKIPYTET